MTAVAPAVNRVASRDASKQNQWRAFLKKSRLQAPELGATVTEIRNFLYGAKHGE